MREPAEYLLGAGQRFRQYQVPDKEASDGHPGLIKAEVTDLTVHFNQGLLNHRWIIHCLGIYLSFFIAAELYIRHVNINNTL